MSNLAELQYQMEYRTDADLVPHPAPCDNSEWNRILKEIGGVCPFGDACLRLVWGGTAMNDGYEQTPKGSKAAQVIKYPAPIGKIKRLKGFTYMNARGQREYVKNAYEIPNIQGIMATPMYDVYQLGTLRWFLERKFTVFELISMDRIPVPHSPDAAKWGTYIDGKGIKRRTIAPTNPKGEYVGLYPLHTLPEIQYFEPTRDWFELLRKTTYETENFNEAQRDAALAEYLTDEQKQEIAREAYKAEQEDILFEETLIEVQKEGQGKVTFDLAKS